MRSKSRRGFTLIELMMAVSIIGIIISMVAPRLTLVLERAYQGRTRAQLGALRSAIQLYYTDTEGKIAYFNHTDGVPATESLSAVLAPTYIAKVPTPYLADTFLFAGINYDESARTHMAANPPEDVVFARGVPGALVVDRPYVYDPTDGHVYICSGNYDVAGNFFYNW
jgi:prepilin-type N-terminal cleavage/methylation domain-containing protein